MSKTFSKEQQRAVVTALKHVQAARAFLKRKDVADGIRNATGGSFSADINCFAELDNAVADLESVLKIRA